MKTETLIATRQRYNHLNQVTTITDNKGKVKAILTGYNQPKKSKHAKITIRGKTYNLKFLN